MAFQDAAQRGVTIFPVECFAEDAVFFLFLAVLGGVHPDLGIFGALHLEPFKFSHGAFPLVNGVFAVFDGVALFHG